MSMHNLTVREHLAQIPDMAAELLATRDALWRPQEAKTASKTVAKSWPKGITLWDFFEPLRGDGGEWRHQPIPQLAQCVRLASDAIWETENVRHPVAEAATYTSECGWLLEHYEEWQACADEAVLAWIRSEVAQVYSELFMALRMQRSITLPCPECGDDLEVARGETYLVCPSGHEQSGAAQQYARLRRETMTTAEAVRRWAAKYGLSPARVAVWKTRRKLRPVGVDRDGADLWLGWDIFCLLDPKLAGDLEVRHAERAAQSG